MVNTVEMQPVINDKPYLTNGDPPLKMQGVDCRRPKTLLNLRVSSDWIHQLKLARTYVRFKLNEFKP